MRVAPCTVLILLTALAVGCTDNHSAPDAGGTGGNRAPDAGGPLDGSAGGYPPDAYPTAGFVPFDVSTDVGATPLQLVVSGVPPFYPQDYHKLASAAVMDELAAAIHLWTYPELDPVTISTSIVIVPIENLCTYNNAPGCDLTHVLVTPDAPLSDRWYILSLDHAPILRDGSAMQIGGATPPDVPIGAFAVRFATGSHPILAGAGTCQETPTSRGVTVGLTETVHLAAAPAGTPGTALEDAVVVTSLPSQVQCTRDPGNSIPPQDPGTLRDVLFYVCPADPNFDGLRVQLLPGLESATGVPVTTLDGRASATIKVTSADTDKLVPNDNPPSGHCLGWRLY